MYVVMNLFLFSDFHDELVPNYEYEYHSSHHYDQPYDVYHHDLSSQHDSSHHSHSIEQSDTPTTSQESMKHESSNTQHKDNFIADIIQSYQHTPEKPTLSESDISAMLSVASAAGSLVNQSRKIKKQKHIVPKCNNIDTHKMLHVSHGQPKSVTSSILSKDFGKKNDEVVDSVDADESILDSHIHPFYAKHESLIVTVDLQKIYFKQNEAPIKLTLHIKNSKDASKSKKKKRNRNTEFND